MLMVMSKKYEPLYFELDPIDLVLLELETNAVTKLVSSIDKIGAVEQMDILATIFIASFCSSSTIQPKNQQRTIEFSKSNECKEFLKDLIANCQSAEMADSLIGGLMDFNKTLHVVYMN